MKSNDPHPLSEPRLSELARAATERSRRAERPFLEAIAPLVLRTVRQVLGRSHPDVEDIVQEALFGTLEALPSFRGTCSTAYFVRRVALLSALNARRRLQLRQHLAPVVDAAEPDSVPSCRYSPAEELDAERRRERFLLFLDELPAAQAETLGLHCVLGFTLAETAAATNVPLNTARGRLVSAKAALRQRLESDPVARDLFRGVS